MEFLGGYEGNCSDEEADSPEQAQDDHSSTHSSDHEDGEAGVAVELPAAPRSSSQSVPLPSVMDLLSQVKSTIHVSKAVIEFGRPLPAMKRNEAPKAEPTVSSKAKPSIAPEAQDAAKPAISRARFRELQASGQAAAPTAPAVAPASREKVGDKDKTREAAKDKVKRQRLGGQSGLGADFRTWRSEDEMRQRQQFD